MRKAQAMTGHGDVLARCARQVQPDARDAPLLLKQLTSMWIEIGAIQMYD
jgi:hypothetical protein